MCLAFMNRKKEISILHNIVSEKLSPFAMEPGRVFVRGIGGSSLASNILDIDFGSPNEETVFFQPITVSDEIKLEIKTVLDKVYSLWTDQSSEHTSSLPDIDVDTLTLKNFVFIPPFLAAKLLQQNEKACSCSITPEKFFDSIVESMDPMYGDEGNDGELSELERVSRLTKYVIPLIMFYRGVDNKALKEAYTEASSKEYADNMRVAAITKAGLAYPADGTASLNNSRANTPTNGSTSPDNTRLLLETLIETTTSQQLNNVACNQLWMETTKINNANNSSKSLFESLPGHARLIFQRASTTDHKNEFEPTGPYETCAEIYAFSNRSKASSSFQSTLRESNQRGEFQRGHITSLLQYGLLWVDPITPEGLTFFAFFPVGSKASVDDRRRELNSALKADHDNHLGTDDILHLTTKTLFIPQRLEHLEMQITCYKVTLSKMIGPSAWVLGMCDKASAHCIAFHSVYTEQFKQDPLFGAKVLFQFDCAFQAYFKSLQASDLHLSEISTYDVRNAISDTLSQVLQFKISSSTLPSNIVSTKPLKAAHKDGGTPPGGGGAVKEPVAKKPKTDQVKPVPTTNPNINLAWKIPTGKDFQPLIQNKDKVPKTKDKDGNLMPFCINFHSTGKCKNGTACKLVHDDPRNVTPSLEAEYTNFMTKAYST